MLLCRCVGRLLARQVRALGVVQLVAAVQARAPHEGVVVARGALADELPELIHATSAVYDRIELLGVEG